MADHAPRRHHQGKQIGPESALYPALPAFDAAEIEAGRLLFAQECRFVAAAGLEGELPPPSLPEVAFLGRSNVGKSSLVNALTGRGALARVSRTPGRTRQIIFFDLRRLMLVDLPGYGFAAASKAEISRWSRLVPLYLKGRAGLKRLLLLIDARHGFKPGDRDVMKLLDQAAVSFQIVLTKLDKAEPPEFASLLEATATELARHTAAYPQLHLTSAHDGFGIAELRAALAALAIVPEAR
jgi:GTP-binding protein